MFLLKKKMQAFPWAVQAFPISYNLRFGNLIRHFNKDFLIFRIHEN
jgi:hypothetical protein